MKRYIIIIILFFTLGFSLPEKRTVEITFNELTELQQLVEMGIDLDHHRTLSEVHAFVTDEEFEQIQQLNFEIKEIPNQAKLYFEELKNNPQDSRNPMGDYHNYNELTAFMQEIADQYPDITRLESIGQSVQGRELWVMEISDNPGVNEAIYNNNFGTFHPGLSPGRKAHGRNQFWSTHTIAATGGNGY